MHQLSSPWGRVLKLGRIALLTLLLVMSLLTGCGSKSASTVEPAAASSTEAGKQDKDNESSGQAEEKQSESFTPVTVKDELGNEVTISEVPMHVFAPYMEDSLLVLGVQPVAQWSNGSKLQEHLKDRMPDVPAINFVSGLPPSAEAVMSFEPDLIVLHNASYAQNGVYENYSQIAPTYVFKNAAGDVESSIKQLAELLGKSAEAEQALQAYQQKVTDTKAKLAPVIEGKTAAIIRLNGKGMFVMGGEYFGGYVLAHELGLAKSKLVEDANSANLSLEILPELGADYIFLANDGGTGDAFVKELTESSIWKGLDAVKNGHVYEVNTEYWFGGGLIAYEKIMDDVVELIAP
ncbi:putative siderophore-binding lipoprotein YfiY precursor [compost metagenome]